MGQTKCFIKSLQPLQPIHRHNSTSNIPDSEVQRSQFSARPDCSQISWLGRLTLTPPRCPWARPATFAQGFPARSQTVAVQRGCRFCECAVAADRGPTPALCSSNRPANGSRQTLDETCVQL